jgi:hypothetical protein
MIKPKFQLGQKVFAVSVKHCESQHVDCDLCNSTGKTLFVHNNENYEITCPKCKNTYTFMPNKYKYEVSYKNATIGRMLIDAFSDEYSNYKSSVSYFLKETGIIHDYDTCTWSEDRLFATEEEANEFCKNFIPDGFCDSCAIPKVL